MAIKKKNSYRLGFLGFIAILCYCLSAMIGLIWVSVGVVWVQGGFEETPVYPTTLYFEYPDLNFANNGTHQNECLRITGITEEMKQDMIDNAEESLKPLLTKNIIVDRKFVVKCDSEEVNMLSINLSSSDPTIATVPQKANIGEEISITPTKVNGVNKGGFVEITAWTSQGIYVSAPLKVLVDVPVQDVTLSLGADFDSEIIEDSPDLDSSLQGLVGERVYYMYENDATTINFAVSPQKSVNPTLNAGSGFATHVRANKKMEFYFDENYAQGNAVQLDTLTGAIKVNSPGVYKIWFKIFKTYDDQIFIDDYEFEFPGIDNEIPESDLYGRYQYAYLNICVKPIVLVDIQTNNTNENPISINLFQTIDLDYRDLNIKLYSNRNEYQYFSNSMDKLVLASSNPNVIAVEKIGVGNWRLTALANESVYFTLYHQDYPQVICELDNVEINLIEINSIIFEGESKYSTVSEHNDLVEMEVNKDETGSEVDVIYASEWSFSNKIQIVSAVPGMQTSYSVYKVFATGSYINGNFEAFNLNNEQDNPIINAGTFYAGIGYEIGTDYITAVSRGEIDLVVCVIKTDINGQPIMVDVVEDNGLGPQIISTYDIVARSNTVTVRVVELLRGLSATIDVIAAPGSEPTTTEITSTSEIVVENSSSVTIQLIPNSLGAIVDATNYNLLRLVYNELDVYPELSDTNLYLTFEIENLEMGVANSQTRDVGIQIYTGNSYETLITLKFRVINVPIQSIQLNINMEKDSSDIYNVYGTPVILKTGNNITSLSFVWGQTLNQTDVVMELLEPTFVPANIEIISENTVIIPRPLEVTNYGHTYISSNTDVLQVQNNQLIVKKHNEAVDLTIKSTADPSKTDTITLKFLLPLYNFQWTPASTNTINVSDLVNGINLDDLGIKLTIEQTDGYGTHSLGDIISGGILNDKISITFTEGDNFTRNNVSIITSYDEDENYLGQFIKSDNSTLTGTIVITAIVECADGLLITQNYSFNLV